MTKQFIFYAEYPDTLSLFFADTIHKLRLSGHSVFTSHFNQYLFSGSSSVGSLGLPLTPKSIKFPFYRLLIRIYKNVDLLILSSNNNDKSAIHVYILPLHIILAPITFFFKRHKYIIICQGLLEGEALLVKPLYTLLLIFSSFFASRSYICSIVELANLRRFFFGILYSKLTPLPWHGVSLSRDRFSHLLTVRNNNHTRSSELRLGYLGRLVKPKGCFELVDVLSCNLDSFHSIKFGGSINSDFNSYVLSRLPPEKCFLLGPIVSDCLHLFFSSIDIYVTFSHGESIGASTLEALASGVPVISLLNSGSAQVLRHCIDSYIITEPTSAQFRAALKYVQLNYSRMALAAKNSLSINLDSTLFLADSLISSP